MKAMSETKERRIEGLSKYSSGNRITEGIIWKQLLVFFFPILIGTFFQQLYNTVDAVVVGRFAGKEALSSVGGSSSQIINLVVSFFTGLSAGATVIISQYFGAKREGELQKALHTAYSFAIWFGILIGAAGFALTPYLMKQMNTPAELMKDSILYVQIYFAGLIFVLIYNMGSAILRSIGDSKRPLYYLMICCIINIILDLALVLGLGLGVLGVAAATLISQAVSALLVTRALMFHTEGLKLKIKEIRIQKEMILKILRIGLPTGIQSCMYNLSNVLIQSSLNQFGVDTMAAWTAFGKIDSIVWMINGAFGIAITTFVGQNFGAGKWARVKKGTRDCLLMTLITEALLSALIVCVGQYLFGIFTSDAKVVEIGLRMVRVISPTYWLFAFIEIYSGSLRAQGTVLMTTLITITGVCVLRVVWIMFLVPNGTLEALIACYPVTWIVTAIAMITYYFFFSKKSYHNPGRSQRLSP